MRYCPTCGHEIPRSDYSQLFEDAKTEPVKTFDSLVKRLNLDHSTASAILANCEGDHRTACEQILEQYSGTFIAGLPRFVPPQAKAEPVTDFKFWELFLLGGSISFGSLVVYYCIIEFTPLVFPEDVADGMIAISSLILFAFAGAQGYYVVKGYRGAASLGGCLGYLLLTILIFILPKDLGGSLLLGAVGFIGTSYYFGKGLYLSYPSVRGKATLLVAILLLGTVAVTAVSNSMKAPMPSETLANNSNAASLPTPKPISLTKMAAALTPENDCAHWSDVNTNMAGRTACVYGTVDHTREFFGASQLRFGNDSEFFFSSGTIYYPDIGRGDCVYTTGRIELSSERVPYININDTGLFLCESWMN
jgi:hypothetical protein